MAFNHRFPDAVPALDTAGLVALISAPQKAAELWAKYEQARKDYEALRASVTAEAEGVDQRLLSLDEAVKATGAARAGFEKEVADFDSAKQVWIKQRNSVEDKIASREAACDDRDVFFQRKQKELDKDRADFNAWQALQASDWDKSNAKLAEVEAALVAREAAVSQREAKADALAKLLKGV